MARKRAHPHHPQREADKANKSTELEQFTKGVVTVVNESLKKADTQHDVIANFLFSSVCEGDTSIALDPARAESPKIRALHQEAGKSLRLNKTSLSRHMRVGAINSLVFDARWHALEWSHKLALLPLVKNPDEDLPSLQAALDAHSEGSTTVRALDAWVSAERKSWPSQPPRATVTIAAAKRFMTTGAQLADAQVLMSLAKRFSKLEDAEREQSVETLRTIAKALPQLLALVEK